MDSKTLLSRYTALAMRLQEEFLKVPQDFAKQRELQNEFSQLARLLRARLGIPEADEDSVKPCA